jgi:hypothetical protein
MVLLARQDTQQDGIIRRDPSIPVARGSAGSRVRRPNRPAAPRPPAAPQEPGSASQAAEPDSPNFFRAAERTRLGPGQQLGFGVPTQGTEITDEQAGALTVPDFEFGQERGQFTNPRGTFVDDPSRAGRASTAPTLRRGGSRASENVASRQNFGAAPRSRSFSGSGVGRDDSIAGIRARRAARQGI